MTRFSPIESTKIPLGISATMVVAVKVAKSRPISVIEYPR